MRNTIGIICLGLLCLSFLGCSNKQRVSGSITFPDGSPVQSGTIYFVTDNYMGRATIDSDGTYDVSSLKRNDGLPPGTYKVYVVGAFKSEEPGSSVEDKTGKAKGSSEKDLSGNKVVTMKAPVPLVHPKFCSADSTPLTFTVPGSKNFDFVVEPFPEANK